MTRPRIQNLADVEAEVRSVARGETKASMDVGIASFDSVDAQERAELIRSLAEAEADIAAGRSTEYDRKTFKDRLVRIIPSNKR